MRTYEYPKLGLENLALVERPVPQPAAKEVVVKFHAASLNYRELLFAWGLYNPKPRLPAVPGSDGAGAGACCAAAIVAASSKHEHPTAFVIKEDTKDFIAVPNN